MSIIRLKLQGVVLLGILSCKGSPETAHKGTDKVFYQITKLTLMESTMYTTGSVGAMCGKTTLL